MSIGQQYKLMNGFSNDNKHNKKKIFEYKPLVLWFFLKLAVVLSTLHPIFLEDGIWKI